MTQLSPAPANQVHFSIPSILAALCAVLSFFTGGWGFFLAVAAIILGLIGLVFAFLPSVRGGVISFLAIGAGLLGLVVALLKVMF